jgi:hypothetical protein
VKLALDGIQPENMTSELRSFTSGMSKEIEEAILKKDGRYKSDV